MININTKIIYCVLILFLPLYLGSQADEMLRVTAVGKSSEKISQKSKARAMALRAATLEAYKKIAEKAGLAMVAQEGSLEYKRIQAFLKGTRLISKRYITDYKAEVVMEIPIYRLKKNVADFKAIEAETKRAQLKKKISSLEKKINILKLQLDALKKKLNQMIKVDELKKSQK